MIITLKGVTNHGKNRIREHGSKWQVIEDHPLTPKPSNLFIESVETGDRRWLSHHFQIVEE